MCRGVCGGNHTVRVQRVLGSGVETILWPDPRWFLWTSEFLFIPAEVNFQKSYWRDFLPQAIL